jgi:hypothetical protein
LKRVPAPGAGPGWQKGQKLDQNPHRRARDVLRGGKNSAGNTASAEGFISSAGFSGQPRCTSRQTRRPIRMEHDRMIGRAEIVVRKIVERERRTQQQQSTDLHRRQCRL